MTSQQPASGNPQSSAPAKLRPLPFAFPFARKGQGPSASSAPFTSEHDIYRLLAEREKGGTYLASSQGVWHGGIHVTEAGAGQSLDLDAGVRCIADGVLVAFRGNKAYPVSEVQQSNGATIQAAYSTGFALVQHEMEFPGGSKLKFYSLYMHLMCNEDYDQNFPTRQKPSYWSRQWTITTCAQDKPLPRVGQSADGQIGLNARKTPNGHPVIGIVPQGASVTIGKIEKVHGKPWGQITRLRGGSLYPAQAGRVVDPAHAVGAWIHLGQENGGPVAKENIPDSTFDQVVVPKDQIGPQGNGVGIPVKAGDALGHLGRYDAVSGNTATDRRVHMEVFCDDSILQFLEQGRDWVKKKGAVKANWETLGLPAEPTILRIESGTALYHRTPDNQFIQGSDPQSNKTGVIQVYPFAELARNKDNQYTEQSVDQISKRKVSWWQVESANALGHAIKGWVREANHPGGGRVTREFAQKWVDFNPLPADAHDTAHTIFATTQAWIDCVTKANVPEPASREKLSPLMQKVYDALFITGNGAQAATELSTLSQAASAGYPWLMQAASRLIVKHESEWSNPSKWQQLYSALEQRSDANSKPALEADQKRIPRLVWWDEVQAGVPGFPGPDVYHINPIGLAGNFLVVRGCCCKDTNITSSDLKSIANHASEIHIEEYTNALNDAFGKYRFDSCISRAHFLAQILHESGEFSATLESNGRGTMPYDPWRGRGLIQITYENNYTDYQTYSGVDVTSSVAAMAKLEKAPDALLSAAWFFAVKSKLIEVSDVDDFIWVTRVINGAYTGYDSRLAYLNRAVDVLGVKNCLKLNKDGMYKFEESKAYNEKRASCAWGMWHDPRLTKTGISQKTATEAIKGYRRYLDLDDAAGRPVDKHGNPKDQGWYGVRGPIRTFVEGRLQALTAS